MTPDKIPEAMAVLDVEIIACEASDGYREKLSNLIKARAAFSAAIDALWVSTEHNAFYFGESHNTVSAGRKALAAVDKLP